MKAIHVREDDARSLVWADTPRPQLQHGEVLLQVHATACNRADLLQRAGRYPVPPGASHILGLEAAGVIAEVGPGSSPWKVGDRACCLLTGGGYAEYVATPASLLLPMPHDMSMSHAAALPEVFYTAFLNICLEAEQRAGELVLVHAGASGVGTAAIQICKAFGSPVIATASGAKLPFLRELGVWKAIDREEEDFASIIDELTEKRGVDIILDPVGAAQLDRNLHCLNTGGRLVVIGLLGGGDGKFSMERLLMKRLRIIGSVLRSRTLQEKQHITAQFTQQVWPLVLTGQLQPVIDRILPIEQAGVALDLLRSNATIGKIVLEVLPSSADSIAPAAPTS